MKATNEQILNAYSQTGSVWKAAELLGMCGQSVHERLVKLNAVQNDFFSEMEIQMLRDLYSEGFTRGDGKLNRLCEQLGRTKFTVVRVAKRLGLSNRGRGITICDRWRTFENFLADMGECPPGLTLDRIDNNGNYEPGNCRWATKKEQNRNQRTNRWIEFHGQKKILADWARDIGIQTATLIERIEKWSLEDALTRPKGGNRG